MQEFFSTLHGHQSKTLAWFVLGAMLAQSVVLPQVAEALLAESEAKVSSIERRLERFLSNPRIDVVLTLNDRVPLSSNPQTGKHGDKEMRRG